MPWSAKLELHRLIYTLEHMLCTFFAMNIEDTWLLPLKDMTTFYNNVEIRTYLHDLSTRRGSLEATNIVQLQASMLGW